MTQRWRARLTGSRDAKQLKPETGRVAGAISCARMPAGMPQDQATMGEVNND
jgi:hypothetical protein